jgi:hypothetical protein
MGTRRIRRDQRQYDQKMSRLVNGELKSKERVRRTARILGLIKSQGKLPYAPSVMSWLSQELDKPSTRITQEDVDGLVNAAQPSA